MPLGQKQTEFTLGRTWRIFRMMAEFVEGYQFLTRLQRAVTIFGSARARPTSKYFSQAHELGRLLAKARYSVITGGGPGIMEAANKGAFEAGGESAGLNIQLPHEQRINPYVRVSTGFYFFFTRKVMLSSPSQAFVFFPGGFGTLDEFFEILDQFQSFKMQKVPMILIDHKFWDPLIAFLRTNAFQKIHALQPEDLKFFQIVDTPAEAFALIKKSPVIRSRCEISPEQFCAEGEDVNWRIFRIMAELVEGFQLLEKVKSPVTIMGTPHIKLDSRFYHDAYTMGKLLGRKGYSIITGGGPGIMEAANKGATHVHADSIGLNILQNHQERINPYVRKSASFSFSFTWKYMLSSPTEGFVLFPGGYGTLTECFEVLTLMQTKKMVSTPIVLYGKEYWQPLLKFLHENVFEQEEAVVHEDLSLYSLADTPQEALQIIAHQGRGLKTHSHA